MQFGVLFFFVMLFCDTRNLPSRSCHLLLRRFLSGCGRVFGFRLVVGEHPMRKAAGEASRSSAGRLHTDPGTPCWLLEIRLAFFRFVIAKRLRGSLLRAPAMFRERLARQDNVIFAAFRRPRRTAVTPAAVVIPA